MKYLLVVAASMFVVSAAIGLAQDEAPVDTAAGSEASDPTPTAVARPEPGTVLLSDNFDDPTMASLPRGPVNPNIVSQRYIDGEYEIGIGPTVAEIGVPVPGTYIDSAIAVSAKVFGGSEQRGIVLACRRQDQPEGAYRLVVRPGQQHFLLQRNDGGAIVNLTDQGSGVIRAGDAWNRIELACVGNTISATINGTELGAVQDTTYSLGRHHMNVAGTGATARFDDLVVTQR